MKEYIEREQAIALFYPVDPENDGSDGCTIVYKSGNFSSSEIDAMLSDLPTIDAVPVVRCQECVYKNTTDCPAYDAPFMRTSLRIKFCSEGQRREDEHEQ